MSARRAAAATSLPAVSEQHVDDGAHPHVAPDEAGDELARLRDEVARLRALVGPDERTYHELRLDVLAARDAALGAEAEVGAQRAYVLALEAEVTRLERDFEWFRTQVLAPLRRIGSGRPIIHRVVRRLSR